MKPERLDKLLAAQSTFSRKDVKAMVRKGLVSVNGLVVKSADLKIDMEKDKVSLCGEPVSISKYSYIMMNKPAGVVSATRDNRERTVIDLVPQELLRDGLFPAGRLDKDTVGFLLITNDGDFAHRILSPKNHVPKTYIAQLDQPIDEEIMVKFEEGFALDLNTDCKPARLKILETGKRELVEVILIEGMYHQIKRMFEHFGRKVVHLQRIRMGALYLDESLAPGECRELTQDELKQITTKI
ncbi:pseudouridine synthase [Hydrogenoanaerobacterium sp.]|uniref:pseudouridine synthase n=1 Tax=Hydrogenoanaerobacterium sp. TaxID=2953763 RepID=UPI00289C29DB|nr:pseudouridine synthase [Hydrogenoanaerobacterium sp.]